MKFELFDLDLISPYPKGPSEDWIVKHYGTTFGKILYDWCCSPNFKIFEENKDLIKQEYLNNKDQPFFVRITKLCQLSHDWRINNMWKNPLIVTNINGAFIVHPGQDRYNIMKAYNVKEYNCCLFEKQEVQQSNTDAIQKLHTSDVKIEFNSKHFTIKNYKVDRSYFEKWLENNITIEQI